MKYLWLSTGQVLTMEKKRGVLYLTISSEHHSQEVKVSELHSKIYKLLLMYGNGEAASR